MASRNIPRPFERKEYADARKMIDSWIRRLITAKKEEAEAISKEKSAYFRKLKAEAPAVYLAMQSEDLSMSEIIHYLITRKMIKF